MNIGEIIINILIVLLILSVLVAIHEAGHLSMAKLFNVYCFEYSLGFGPKIFSKKRKKGETAFSLRILPFGGFVSMYGEPDAIPDGFERPDENRSLESIAKWKKSLILVAGVTMNFTLGLILIYCSCLFPQYYSSYAVSIRDENVYLIRNEYTQGFEISNLLNESLLEYNSSAEQEGKNLATLDDYYFVMPVITNYGYLLDDEVRLYNASGIEVDESIVYSAVYFPNSLVDKHDLSKCVRLYKARELNEIESKYREKFDLNYLPSEAEMKEGHYYKPGDSTEGYNFKLDIKIINSKNHAKELSNKAAWNEVYDNRISYGGIKFTYGTSKLESAGVQIKVISERLSFKESVSSWSRKVPAASSAVVKGFISLFSKDGLKNISGIVGMTAAMPQLQATGGVSNIFYFAGLISINLAFFNLLPFPALDGWGIFVTAVEGVTKKKIPAKIQGIVSFVGIMLLMGLMVLVLIKDVVGLVI